MKEMTRIYLRWGVAGLALLFMGIGAVRGELLIVWMKAINVCLECIGIG